MQDIRIRSATPADAEVISVFNQNMAKETESIVLVPEIIDNGVRRLIENPHLGFYLVAQHKQQIVGSLMITTEWSDWRNGVFWWIQSVYVLPDRRRQGIYSALYREVKHRARKQGDVCGFRLYVELENATAQTAYEHLGMRRCRYHIYEEPMKP